MKKSIVVVRHVLFPPPSSWEININSPHCQIKDYNETLGGNYLFVRGPRPIWDRPRGWLSMSLAHGKSPWEITKRNLEFSRANDAIFSCHPPKQTAGSPENGGPLEKEIPNLETIHFQVPC